MQSFERCGLAPRRDAIGAELLALATRHGLPSIEVLGHLIRMQARGALGDFAAADEHAAAADRLDARHERPLVDVFTTLYRAMRKGRRPRIGTPPSSCPARACPAWSTASFPSRSSP